MITPTNPSLLIAKIKSDVSIARNCDRIRLIIWRTVVCVVGNTATKAKAIKLEATDAEQPLRDSKNQVQGAATMVMATKSLPLTANPAAIRSANLSDSLQQSPAFEVRATVVPESDSIAIVAPRVLAKVNHAYWSLGL